MAFLFYHSPLPYPSLILDTSAFQESSFAFMHTKRYLSIRGNAIMANIIKLGSILLDGLRTKPGSKYQPGQTIDFGNGDSLQWIVVNDMLIADRPLLVNISWDDLNDQGLVFGKQVTINGHQFLCRLLHVGAEGGVPNEWDAALDVVGEYDDLWHWYNTFCWGQECVKASCRAIRGYAISARRYSWTTQSRRLARYGFRPALVPLPSDNLISGSKVCAIGGQSMLYGTLLEVTDYDAVIRLEQTPMMAASDEGKCYSKLQDGMVILDRASMVVQTIKEK